jgi:hypothetical protein
LKNFSTIAQILETISYGAGNTQKNQKAERAR